MTLTLSKVEVYSKMQAREKHLHKEADFSWARFSQRLSINFRICHLAPIFPTLPISPLSESARRRRHRRSRSLSQVNLSSYASLPL